MSRVDSLTFMLRFSNSQCKHKIKSGFKQCKERFTRVQRLSDGRVKRVRHEGMVPGNL